MKPHTPYATETPAGDTTHDLNGDPGDASAAICTLENGEPTGPYIQGGPGNRFIYLSWGAVTEKDPRGTLLDRVRVGAVGLSRSPGW